MGFSRQEYWNGLPFPSPGDLPDPGIEPGSPALEADTLTSEPPGVRSCQSEIQWLFWKGIKKVTKGKLLENKDILYRKPYHTEYMLSL